MLKLLKKSTTVQLLVLAVAMVLLWGRAVVHPVAMTAVDGGGLLYELLLDWLGGCPLLAVLLTAVLVLAEGIGLNLLLSDIGLTSKDSLLPALLYVVVMSAPATPLSPAVLIGGALIIYLHQAMLRGTLLTIPTGKVCSATALLGVCTLIYLPSVLLLLSYLVVVVAYRLYSWRDWMALMLGLLAPYIAVGMVLYLMGGIDTWWTHTTDSASMLGLHIAHISTWSLVGRIVIVLLAAYSLVVAIQRMNEYPMAWQKNAQVVLGVYAGAAAMVLLTEVVPPDVRFLAVPFTLSGTQMLTVKPTLSPRRKSHNWLPDMLLILTIVASLIC